MEETHDLISFDENIQIDEEARGLLKDITRWGKFVSIGSIILLVLASLIFMLAGSNSAVFGSTRFSTTGPGTYMLVLIGCIIQCVLLYRFSNISDEALSNDDISEFNRALNSLKVYFIISGVSGLLVCFFTLFKLI